MFKMIKQNRQGAGLLFKKPLFLLATTFCMLLLSATLAFAAPTLEVVIAGAKSSYPAGGSVVVTGQISNKETVNGRDVITPITSQPVVRVVIGDFVSAETTADSSGYFKILLKIPSDLSGSFDIEAKSMGLSASKNITVLSNSSGVKYVGTTFLTGEKADPKKTSLGVVFDSNVNYYNNKFNESNIVLGVNENNIDCVSLVNAQTLQQVPIRVDLAENATQGDVSVNYYEGGTKAGITERKRVIYIDPVGDLASDTKYYINIAQGLSANSGDTLNSDVQVHFTTAKSDVEVEKPKPGNSGSSNKIEVVVKPETNGQVVLTDTQVKQALESVKPGESNIVAFVVKAQEAGTANSFALQMTSSQTNLLKSADGVAFQTPIGQVVLPVSVLKQTSGKVSLNVSKSKDKTDSFTVVLTDEKGNITNLSGLAKLQFKTQAKGDAQTVMLHNGQMMKNGYVKNNLATCATNGFSEFTLKTVSIAFEDISGHWAENNIKFLAARNIINGMEANKFAPNNTVTRGEFVKMLTNAFDEIDVKNAQAANFTDVKTGQWYCDYVNYAFAKGIAKGLTATEFGVDSKISRQDMCLMIDRFATAMKINLPAVNTKTTFADDSSIAGYAKDGVYRMQQAGLVNGTSGNKFAPTGNASRAEVAKIINLLIEKYVANF